MLNNCARVGGHTIWQRNCFQPPKADIVSDEHVYNRHGYQYDGMAIPCDHLQTNYVNNFGEKDVINQMRYSILYRSQSLIWWGADQLALYEYTKQPGLGRPVIN